MPTPRMHLIISRSIQEQILSGELEPGDSLPTEAQLCAKFGASRGPVRQALANLRAEGLITSGRGRRSMVLGTGSAEHFMSLLCNYTWLKKHNFDPICKTLWMTRRPAPKRVAKSLRLEEDEPILFVGRMLFNDGNPVVLEQLYFPLHIGMHLVVMENDKRDIFEELIRQGVGFDTFKRSFQFATADSEVAEELNLEVGDVLNSSHIQAFDHSGTPILYAEYLYPAVHHNYSVTISQDSSLPLHTHFKDGTYYNSGHIESRNKVRDYPSSIAK